MATEIALFAICFFAALVQTTTGLGFGFIVAPILLVFFSPVEAVQITGALTLGIVMVITPFVTGHIVPSSLSRLFAGSVVGLAAGSALLVLLSIEWIRLAALVVLGFALVRFMTAQIRGRSKTTVSDADLTGKSSGLFYGLGSGVMAATLAMPGPLALLFLRDRHSDPRRIRATLFALMICSYSGMLLISVAMNGLTDDALRGLLQYMPPTLLGLMAGSLLAKRLPNRWFDALATLLLGLTVALLGAKVITTYI